MIDISFTDDQLLTCKDLLQEKITGVKLNRTYLQMDLDRAKHFCSDNYDEAEINKEIIKDIKNTDQQIKELEIMLRKFDKGIGVIN